MEHELSTEIFDYLKVIRILCTAKHLDKSKMIHFYSYHFLMKLSISISAGRAVFIFLQDAVFALEQGLLRCDGGERPHDGLYLLKVWL